MTQFLYPGDLVPICKDRWERFQRILLAPKESAKKRTTGRRSRKTRALQRSRAPPFPSDADLKEILDVIYHVSFLTEENRRLGVRIMYVPSDMPIPDLGTLNFDFHREPVRFTEGIPLSVSALLKLAPAVQATEAAILVSTAIKESRASTTSLIIWGIFHFGTEWWDVLTSSGSAALAPPNSLTVSCFSPGSITVSTLGSVLVRLRGGQLIGTPLPDPSVGLVGAFLGKAAEALYTAAIAKLGCQRYSSREDSDQHPRQLYYRTLSRILHLIREQRHGGTMLLIPDELNATDARLRDRVSLKYSIESPVIWPILVDETVANKRYFELLFPKEHVYLPDHSKASAKQLQSLIHEKQSLENAQEKIEEFARFVAALSAVDGAVVITERLRVLGFGAEISASSPSLLTVKQSFDPDGKTFVDVPIATFGTRHRSAARMCSSFEDCLAFVVSQDGPIKAIKRKGPDVYMWGDVNLGHFAL